MLKPMREANVFIVLPYGVLFWKSEVFLLKREVTYSCRSDSFCGERAADALLRLLDDGGEMLIALQALGVEFVDIFRPGRTRGKPTACRDDFQSADRCIISQRTCEFCRDRFACEFCGCDGFGRELLKQVLLLGRGCSVDAGIVWRSELGA
jgi:hypothetical protein